MAAARATTDGAPEAGRLARLSALLEVSRSLTSELDLTDIIQEILEGAVRVIPAAHAGIVSLYDADRRKLIVKHTIGLGPSAYELQMDVGEGISGRAFTSRRAQIYPDLAAVRAVMEGSDRENLRRFAEATRGIQYPEGAIGAALVYKGEALGAMVVENLHSPGTFEPFDAYLLDALARFAAIAIVNARLYQAERDSRLKLEALNSQLRAHGETLERRMRVQESLSEAVREGISPAGLVQRLARITGRPVLLLDGLCRPRAAEPVTSSSPEQAALASTALEPWLRRAARTRAQQVATEGGRTVLVTPAVSGRECLGFLLCDYGEGAPDPVDRWTADAGALIAAADFLRERAAEEGEIRRRGELLEQLLSGRGPVGLRALSHLRPPYGLAVGVASAPAGHDGARLRGVRALLGVAQEAADRAGLQAVVAAKDGRVVVLWPLSSPSRTDALAHQLELAVDRLAEHAPGTRATFAIGDEVPDLARLGAGYEETRAAAEVYAELGRPERVARVQSLGIYRLLIRSAAGRDVVELCREILGGVAGQGSGSSERILAAFGAYVRGGYRVKAAAAELGVHPHTIRYRLDRLQQLTGLSLRRSEERLMLELAHHLLRLSSVRPVQDEA
jgi:hypothetical protein